MGINAALTPGVWRCLDKETWQLYPVQFAETIFAAFCCGEKNIEWVDVAVPVKKRKRDADTDDISSTYSRSTAATHRVDLERMKEVQLSTGLEVDIKIVQAAISDINYTPTENPVETGVWWKDNSGRWHCYAGQTVQKIRNAWRRQEYLVTLKKVVTRRYPEGVKYIINLRELTQTNPITSHRRPIQIISNSSLPSEIASPIECKNLTVISVGSNLVRGGLQRLISLEFLQSTVVKMVQEPHEIQAIELNKYLKDGDCGQIAFERFRDAYETIIKRIPGCCGQLMRLILHTTESFEKASSPNHVASVQIEPILKYVLYLAPPSDFDDILKNGIHSGCHYNNFFVTSDKFGAAIDYFKLHHKVWEALDYSLLVFLVLAPQISDDSARLLNAIPSNSADRHHQLPIAVLKLRKVIHAEPVLGAHESGQSGATDSAPIACATPGGSGEVLPSTMSREGSAEITVPDSLAASTHQIFFASSFKEDVHILLLFKLYCPDKEELRFVGGCTVLPGGRPTQTLGWLREMAGFAPDSEILLYKENSSECIDQNSTYVESQLVSGDVVIYSNVLTGDERRSYRCPDLPAFLGHVRDRHVMRFRRLSSPMKDEFSLDLTNQNTYSDVVDRVAQHLGLEDDARIRLTYNDCFLQQPRHVPLDSRSFSTIIANAYKQTLSILYFEILDSLPAELDGSKTLTVSFHNGKGEKISVHSIEMQNQSRVKDVIEKLRGEVELRNPADAEMRIFEVYCNRVTRIHPSNERVRHVSTLDSSSRVSLRAMEIPEEEKDLAPQDRLLHVRHLHCRGDSSHLCDYFGEPFLMVAREHETLAHLKERIIGKVKMSEQEFLECKFPLLSPGRRDYIRDGDLVVASMHKFSLGSYDPLNYYLGIESPKRKPQKGTFSEQKVERSPDLALVIHAPKRSPAKSGSTLSKSKTSKSPQEGREFKKASVRLEEKLQLVSTVVASPISANTPERVPSQVTQIMVPDPEFHNFDALRTEKDVMAGQVWAIYDNHDGMPRYYAHISQVYRSPFKVELSWLEPQGTKRFWVESTGLSITCGDYEISPHLQVEKNIGVFSHLVLEKTPNTRLIKVYPKQGDVWAVYRNWDVQHELGPEPVLTPDGVFGQSYEYDIMEMLGDYSSQVGVIAVKLVKTKGFKTVFHQQEGPLGIKSFLPEDLRMFSHSVPAEKIEHQLTGIPPEAVELDPASLPLALTVVDWPPAAGETE